MHLESSLKSRKNRCQSLSRLLRCRQITRLRISLSHHPVDFPLKPG